MSCQITILELSVFAAKASANTFIELIVAWVVAFPLLECQHFSSFNQLIKGTCENQYRRMFELRVSSNELTLLLPHELRTPFTSFKMCKDFRKHHKNVLRTRTYLSNYLRAHLIYATLNHNEMLSSGSRRPLNKSRLTTCSTQFLLHSTDTGP